MRALLFFGLVIVIFFGIRFIINRMQQIKEDTIETQTDTTASEHMVVCEQCGVHLPQSEAINVASETGQHHFCSQAHLEAFIEDKQKG